MIDSNNTTNALQLTQQELDATRNSSIVMQYQSDFKKTLKMNLCYNFGSELLELHGFHLYLEPSQNQTKLFGED